MAIRYHISDRFGGISAPPYDELNIAYHTGDDPEAVERNRAILYQMAGIEEAVFMDQIHSCEVRYVDRICQPTCDGLVTDQANLPLAVMSADCYGVLLYDEDRGIVAALHAGRAGAMGGIVPKAIGIMRSLGAIRIEGIISPGIGACCYEVGPEILSQVDRRYIKNGRFLDIKGMIKDQLSQFGVPYHDYGICTSCDRRYYSYRREGRTGRFASIIWRE